MNRLAIVAATLVAIAIACGGGKKDADKPAQSAGPHSTVDQSLNPQGTAWTNVQQRPAYTTLDPNLVPGGAASAPPPKPVQPAAAPNAGSAAKPGAGSAAPIAKAGSGAGSAAPPKTPTSTLSTSPPTSVGSAAPVAPPVAPTAPAAPQPKAVALIAPSTPNSCAKHGRECSAMVTAAVAGPPTAANKGTVTGQLVTPDQMPSCPVDLVDGATRRVTTGTFRAGKYELSASPGRYAVSFERCLGCDPGTVPVDIVDGAAVTATITCRAH